MTPLEGASDAAAFGGKAAQLAEALALGLPVPGGFALDVEASESVARGEPLPMPDGRWAVRSSAVGEDSSGASFAGIHRTELNVAAIDVRAAVARVVGSAHDEAALAYRRRRGVRGPVRMAVVLQRMVDAEVAGVMFTRNPMTGARERVIEASWGLGEVVVSGLVTPDTYRVSPDGRILERRTGLKDLAVRLTESGTEEVEVPVERREAPCLDDATLGRLHALATQVERALGGDHDIEWALGGAGLHLLQRRAITAVAGQPRS